MIAGYLCLLVWSPTAAPRVVDELTPQIAFQLLAIAMALAAFLPPLIYSYSKDLLESIQKRINGVGNPLNDNLRDAGRRLISFFYAIDLILTQSIILVFITALVGICVYLSTQLNWQPDVTSRILIAIFLLYFSSILFSLWYFNEQIGDKHFDEWWHAYPHYRAWWLVVVLAYDLSCLVLSFAISECDPPGSSESVVVILALSTLWLIGSALIWIVPLVQYQPLMREVEEIKGNLG